MAQIIARKKKSADGKDTWLIRIFDGLGSDGKRRYVNHTIMGGKKDAEKAARALETKRDQGSLIEPSKQTLQTYLTDWLNEVAKKRVQERTWNDYAGLMKRAVFPTLGDKKLARLQHDPMAFQKLISAIEQQSGVRTAQYATMILKQAMKHAVRLRMIEFNPMEAVERPRGKAREMHAMDEEQVTAFLQAAKDKWDVANASSYYPLFKLMLDAGCRPGEALALTWSDLDNDCQTMRITKSLERIGGTWRVKEPKTPGSRRSVALTESTAKDLRQHRAAQREYRMAHRDEYKDHDFIFAAQNGEPLDKQNVVHRHFKPLLKRAGLPSDIRLYDLRHTCATLLLKHNVHPKIVSERLGNSVTMVLGTYSHVQPGMQKVATDALEDVFAP